MALGRTVREINSMSLVEYMGWQAFENIEPFGSVHSELMAGSICAVIANVNRDPEKRKAPWSATDFMPALRAALHGPAEVEPEQERAPPTPEQEAAFLDAVFGFGS